jgi:hypothetical protein
MDAERDCQIAAVPSQSDAHVANLDACQQARDDDPSIIEPIELQPRVSDLTILRPRGSPRDAALGNLLRDPNWLLGSGFCRSRCWLGYYNRIGNRLRNIYGFRAGLMSTNHARPP